MKNTVTEIHCGSAGLLAPFLAGAAVVIPAGGKFSAAAFWKDACKWGVTFYTAVPTIHQVGWHLGPTSHTATLSFFKVAR